MSAVVLAFILGWVVGAILHEAAHFVVGYHMGTCKEAGVVVPDHHGLRRFLPVALYVGHTHQNWWSTFAPLAFIMPWSVLELAYRFGILELTPLFIGPWMALFTAWGAWLASDLPHILGWLDPFSGDRRLVPLIEVEPDPAYLSMDGGKSR